MAKTTMAEKRRQILFLLAHEGRAFDKVIVPQLGEAWHTKAEDPWDVAQSPRITFTLETTQELFGPVAFADVLRRMEQAGVLVPTEEAGVYHFGKHPAYLDTKALEERFCVENTPKDLYDAVACVRASFSEATTHYGLVVTWLRNQHTGIPAEKLAEQLVGFRGDRPPPKGPRGVISPFSKGSASWASDAAGLGAVDFLLSPDGKRKAATYSTVPLPADAELSPVVPVIVAEVVEGTSVEKSTEQSAVFEARLAHERAEADARCEALRAEFVLSMQASEARIRELEAELAKPPTVVSEPTVPSSDITVADIQKVIERVEAELEIKRALILQKQEDIAALQQAQRALTERHEALEGVQKNLEELQVMAEESVEP